MTSGRKGKRDNNEKEMSFLEHLEELRWHILRSILAIVIFTVIAFIEKDFIFNKIILAPKNPEFFTNSLFCKLGNSLLHSDIL
ncbi:MAG TPA: twin-arginine translocase subunit TatC, partial [Bacteroidales bacterium]|nr:twin-arginine translocase subunit TatC [Bacteroidales bacterium]